MIFVVVHNVLLIKFRLEIYINDTIGRQTFVSVCVHPECVLPLIVYVVKAYINVRNMADLVLG